jgi:hypothetical protein
LLGDILVTSKYKYHGGLDSNNNKKDKTDLFEDNKKNIKFSFWTSISEIPGPTSRSTPTIIIPRLSIFVSANNSQPPETVVQKYYRESIVLQNPSTPKKPKPSSTGIIQDMFSSIILVVGDETQHLYAVSPTNL